MFHIRKRETCLLTEILLEVETVYYKFKDSKPGKTWYEYALLFCSG